MFKPMPLFVLGSAVVLVATSCGSSGSSGGEDGGGGAGANSGAGASAGSGADGGVQSSTGGTGASGTAGTGGRPSGCSAGQITCNATCVDTATSPTNCGKCGKACGANEVCTQGACKSSCTTGESNCSRACVDTQKDAANCGTCGVACASGETCSKGACICPADRVACQGSCVATSTDPANCGSCGKTCGTGETCAAGTCTKAAPPPPVVTASCSTAYAEDASCAASAKGKTYYVSTAGNDQNSGLTEALPLKTLAKASALALSPGDQVLFKCGDTWRGETLIIGSSGADCRHIVYSSYPANCENQPRFSGSQPITGWTRASSGFWVANLAAGTNAGRFPKGINQLFRGDQRLPLGRWPNADDTTPGLTHGYAHIDAQPSESVIQDAQLPAGDWTGAVIRYFSIRWLLLNRLVTSSGDHELHLNSGITCYDGCGTPTSGKADAFGWGYQLTNHLATLDQQDEWFYDEKTQNVHLVSGAEPADMEGSTIPTGVALPYQPTNDEGYHGLIELGPNMKDAIHHVVVDNLRVENGWRHGIATPVNQTKAENSELVIRCNTMRNLDGIGLNLSTWVLDDPTQADAWRGGNRLVVANNVIDGPNAMGIQSFAHDSTFQDNLIKNIGLAENLGKSGLGCRFEGDGCTENGDGVLLRRDGKKVVTSVNVTFRRNRIEKTGYCGLDTFGQDLLFEENVIQTACYTKGDCGGIRVFGATGITIKKNLILDVPAPIDGTNSGYHERFGFGLYVDMGSVADSSDNLIRNSGGYGIIYQGKGTKGNVTGNTLFGVTGRSMVFAAFDGGIDSLTDNILVAVDPTVAVFTEGNGSLGPTDRNYYIQPYRQDYMNVQLDPSTGNLRTLAKWQTDSGKDLASKGAWFTLAAGAAPTMELFFNDTDADKTVALTKSYVDLDRKAVTGSITLAPFSSKILVAQ